jgi:hypothetical protein
MWLAADSHGILQFSVIDKLLNPIGANASRLSSVLQFVLITGLFLWASHSVASAMPVIIDGLVGGRAGENDSLEGEVKGLQSRTNGSGLGLRTRCLIALAVLWAANIIWDVLQS